jgi:acyl-CoA thioester hydrolase
MNPVTAGLCEKPEDWPFSSAAQPAVPAPAGTHRFPVRVYYEDTDAGGVVYHAGYLRFAERARTEAMRAVGAPHAELLYNHDLSFMVRRIEIEYWRPARLDDALIVETRLRSLRGASAILGQDVLAEDGTKLVSIIVRLACVGTRDGRAARIPDRFRAALERLSGSAPGGEE